MAVSHWPGADDTRPTASRDQCLLLSAAIYRLLRRGSAARRLLTQDAAARESENGASARRIENSRQQLLTVLKRYNKLLRDVADQASQGEAGSRSPETPQFAPELARRAIMALKALAESVVIVVPINRVTAPTVLTVKVPTRTLNSPREWKLLKPSTWMLRPLGRLEIDALSPTADADREVQIHLPDGMAFEASNSKSTKEVECPRMNILVTRPQPLEDLTALISQVLDQSQSELPSSLLECLARDATSAARNTLRELRAWLDKLCNCRDEQTEDKQIKLEDARTELENANENFQRETASLFRRTSVDRPGPRTLLAQVDMIEEVYQRATPSRARIRANVAVTDGEYFSIARFSGRMSLLLMTVVLAFLIAWDGRRSFGQRFVSDCRFYFS